MSEMNFNRAGHFKRITTFGQLNGRKKQRVLIGDEPHLLECRPLEVTRVIHNWPSHWHSRFSEGYIIFESGKKFDLKTETIERKSVFLFWFNEHTEVFYRRHTLEERIFECADKTSSPNLYALIDLIIGASREKSIPSEYVPISSIPKYLMLLSVIQLEEIVGLISIPEPIGKRWFRGEAA